MPPSHTPRLILASGSAYRKELLSRLQLSFDVISPDIDETPLLNEKPPETALRLAESKAKAVAQLTEPALIIGSDQLATLDEEHIGKPGNHERALAQLKKMRGHEVIFHTALCLLDNRPNSKIPLQIDSITTAVKFRDLPDDELDAYLHREKPYDCAGSAKNEGLGIALIDYVRSDDPTALTGLPLIALTRMLRAAGLSLFNH
jgi:septum formation protein